MLDTRISKRFSSGCLRTKKLIIRDKYLLAFILPTILYLIIFHYIPMYGALIAFKDYKLTLGVFKSNWVGFKWFTEFFSSYYFKRIIRNTVLLSLYSHFWGFPIPIIFALMVNELEKSRFKKIIQTVSYMPHFISVVVVVGIMINILSPRYGVVNLVIQKMGGRSISFMGDPKWFRTLYISSGIWQSFGWNSIVYLSALSAVDQQLYDAAYIDGCNKWKRLIHVTIPAIIPTIMILFILNFSKLMNVGHEKILLMYNPSVYETADVISTFIYRRGIELAEYSYATAVGLFNSLINLITIIFVNKIVGKVSETSLW